LYTQHQSLQKSMDRLQDEQRQAQDLQAHHLQSLDRSVLEGYASRQAHIAIWKNQLLQAGKAVTEKLAQVGLTSASTDDYEDDDERTCLEQVEIDQDNEESEMSSVVVVRVPKVFFRSTKDNSSPVSEEVDDTSSAATATTRSTSVTEPRRGSSEIVRKDVQHIEDQPHRPDPISMDTTKRREKLGPPIPEGVFSNAAGCAGSKNTPR
jgi:hypothetical protein